MTGLRTVRKPIAQAGTWKTSVGNGAITVADLQAVVNAQADGSVPRTRVTLGHTVEASKDGAVRVPRPVMGHADNYSLDGDTLFADFHLPGWLADEMERVTPGRSIEGVRAFETRNGTTHDMVIPVIALLSDQLPAIETMDDFQNVVSRGAESSASRNEGLLVAASRLVVCAMPEEPKPAPVRVSPRLHPDTPVGILTDDGLETRKWSEIEGTEHDSSFSGGRAAASRIAASEAPYASAIEFTPEERERVARRASTSPARSQSVSASRGSAEMPSGGWLQAFESPAERAARDAAAKDAENARVLAEDDARIFGDDLPASVLNFSPQVRETMRTRRGL